MGAMGDAATIGTGHQERQQVVDQQVESENQAGGHQHMGHQQREEENEDFDLVAREPEEIAAEDAGNRPRGTDQRHLRAAARTGRRTGWRPRPCRDRPTGSEAGRAGARRCLRRCRETACCRPGAASSPCRNMAVTRVSREGSGGTIAVAEHRQVVGADLAEYRMDRTLPCRFERSQVVEQQRVVEIGARHRQRDRNQREDDYIDSPSAHRSPRG